MTDQDRKYPGTPPAGFGSALTNPNETRAFRDKIAIETALKLVESGRFDNLRTYSAEIKAIAHLASGLADRMTELRK